MAVETANLNGLSQAGAPVMMRGSTSMPTSDAPAATTISTPTAVSGGLARHNRSSPAAASVPDVMGRGVESMIGPPMLSLST